MNIKDTLCTKIEKRISQVVYGCSLLFSLILSWSLEFTRYVNPRPLARTANKQTMCITSAFWASNKLRPSPMRIKEDSKGLTWEDSLPLGQALQAPLLTDSSTHLSMSTLSQRLRSLSLPQLHAYTTFCCLHITPTVFVWKGPQYKKHTLWMWQRTPRTHFWFPKWWQFW